MSTPLSTTARKAALAGILSVINGGGGGQVKIYAGEPPASPSLPVVDGLLAVINLAAVAGVVDEDGAGRAVLTVEVPKRGTVSTSGIVGFVRLANGAGDPVCDLRASKVGDSPAQAAVLSDVVVWAGGDVNLLQFVLRY